MIGLLKALEADARAKQAAQDDVARTAPPPPDQLPQIADELDRAVAGRDSNPAWFATLPSSRQKQIDRWAQFRANQTGDRT